MKTGEKGRGRGRMDSKQTKRKEQAREKQVLQQSGKSSTERRKKGEEGKERKKTGGSAQQPNTSSARGHLKKTEGETRITSEDSNNNRIVRCTVESAIFFLSYCDDVT